MRAERKRHARPGETVQLYTGMRTKYCRKLVMPDPVCLRLDDIRLDIGDSKVSASIDGIEINGRALDDHDIEAFAAADGFAPAHLGPSLAKPGERLNDWVTARILMALFWKAEHGTGAWQGVVVRWEPRGETA